MADDAASSAIELAYADVVKLIHMQINRLVRNGIVYNREQALSDANLAFVKAWSIYELNRSKFDTHIGYRVRMGILTEFKKLYRKSRPLTFSELDEFGKDQIQRKLSLLSEPIEREFPEWTEKLSKDAKKVIKMILNPPKDLTMFMEEHGNENANTYKTCVKEYLSYMGWSKRKTKKAFDEIRRAIKG